ncbi:protein YgfX [Acinetobacter sp. ANC 4636]
MFTSNLSFQLKPSKVAWFFQFGLYSLLMLLCYLTLAWYLVVLVGLLALLAWYVFMKQRQVVAFAQLKENEWTAKYTRTSQIQHLSLKKLLDHEIYIVLYWQEEAQPCIVWRDQLTLKEWKQLKILAKLHRASVPIMAD